MTSYRLVSFIRHLSFLDLMMKENHDNETLVKNQFQLNQKEINLKHLLQSCPIIIYVT